MTTGDDDALLLFIPNSMKVWVNKDKILPNKWTQGGGSYSSM